MAKRLFDLSLAGLGLLLAGPLLLLIAAAIRLSDSGPIFFRQYRVGRHGRHFCILKFRTMVPGAEHLGTSVTSRGDPRVTAVGRILRRTKLDELPQLWNVVKGDMSLVGPRPEVPRYVRYYTPEQRQVLELKPGVTDLATLLYRNEEEVLRNVDDVEAFYVREVLPRKIQLNLAYAAHANRWEDAKVILRTLLPGIPLPIRGEPCCSMELPGSTG
jgi:lipopolysaccharide/colanic/teichoic acid biosynthesis glycosyltransferase